LRVILQTPAAVIPATSASAAAEHKVGPGNNFLHSMFNQIDVYFNQKLVSPPNNAYAYRAYFETLLNYSSEVKPSHLTTCLWDSDPPGLMDDGFDAPTENPALDKFLINGVEMRLRLIRSKDYFCLMESTPQTRVRIVDATLIMRRAKLSAGVVLAHVKKLSKTTAKYLLTRVEVKSFTIHRGVVRESIDNAILGQLTKRVIIGFVENKAFTGDNKLNPFNFKNFNINFLSLYIDGMQVPTRPLQPSISRDSPFYIEAFHTLFSETGIHFLNEVFWKSMRHLQISGHTGVYPADRLLRVWTKWTAIVANTDNPKQPGTH
ncbi:uncharacterized protein F54H12.2-like, partial [Pseudomyrmex gracilis]|uniref:uncharacterized protein F54H12.2-like n=1 Tax=Pseudomyrmex gracilis TaxID=219809 RepID=UPI000995620C